MIFGTISFGFFIKQLRAGCCAHARSDSDFTQNMRNLCLIAVCLVLGATVCSCSSVPLHRVRRKSDSKLKSFTERYALPTNVHPVTSKLPLTYGYRFTDDYGTIQSREEKTDPNGSKTGSYSFIDASGLYRRVEYIADRHGFRATVTTNEPGTMSVDPAHVRMLTENKHIKLGSLNHATGISPQLEFSSNIFSRYNLTGDDYEGDKSDLPNPSQSLKSLPKTPLFEPEHEQLEKPKYHNINSYKGSPVSFSPEISSLIDELDDPQPVVYVSTQNLNSNKFYNEPDINSDHIFDEKLPHGEYLKKVPTRYPRRHRNTRVRSKSRQAFKIHIPKGYEDRDDLPLYRDK